jgi:hypothetical protein
VSQRGVAKRLLEIDDESLGRASMRSVNKVGQRGYDEARRVMLSGVNLTDDYVRQRMDFEPANDPKRPEAVIVAFRPGGERKPATRPVNLRQYNPVQISAPVRWPNPANGKPAPGRRPAVQPFSKNPRGGDSKLPFVLRKGTTEKGAYNMPVGKKASGISVEVVKGRREIISYAFVATARAGKVDGGQGLLVFKRDKNDKHGKGKMISLHSLSVWQLFRHSAAKVIPIVADDLQKTLVDEVGDEIEKLLNKP